MIEQAITVSNLTKCFELNVSSGFKRLLSPQYQKTTVLDSISFNIEVGDFVGYLGPNGAGKTTTLKILSGILYPTGGSVRVLGRTPARKEPELLREIAFIMGQKSQLDWDLPAMDTFLLNQAIYDIEDKLFRGRMDELTELLNARDLPAVPVRKLSLGQRMKMEITASLLHGPKVLFLDEPTIGLDMVSQEAIRKFFREYNRKYKATILLTSHYITDIETLARKLIVINKGRVMFDGSQEEIVGKFHAERMLKLSFKKEIPQDIASFGTLLSSEDNSCTLSVHADNVKSVLRHFTQGENLLEVNIDEVPLEYALKNLLA